MANKNIKKKSIFRLVYIYKLNIICNRLCKVKFPQSLEAWGNFLEKRKN